MTALSITTNTALYSCDNGDETTNPIDLQVTLQYKDQEVESG